ncbi:MAG: hypothetical protein EA370_05735 [Wenzhouxiangella sp.]|nr:MAG: hypothetical protein EA370_05735 [Wenzhouxiangella sp.]
MRRRAVDRLLIDYLELPESEQPAWLARTRRRLPRLGSWLVQLIDDSHTVTLLDESVRRLAGQSVDRMEISVTRLVSGDRLGPWKVIEEVGQGGMGRVYRGQRADGAFEMDVAIKQIGQRRRGLAELLQRECRLLAKLDHPSVTRLVDAGLDDRAGPFLVMEWVEGMDLADWLKQEKLDLVRRLELFEQIAEAVAHAHQRLIVHGDIKPDNVRIRDDGSVKLMDFGVARLLDSGEADQAGLRALTPAFAAPEQRAGDDITPASDVWALGALLAWLLTGASPSEKRYTNPSLQKSGIGLRNQELAAIIDKAQAEAPTARYSSIDEFLGDLTRLRRHEAVSVMPATSAYRFGKFVRRNPTLVGGIGATFLALGVGLVIAAWMYVQAEHARVSADIAREQAEANARETEQVADFQARQMGEINLPGLALDLREQLLDAGFEPPSGENHIDLTELLLGLIQDHLLSVTVATTDSYFANQPLVKVRLLQSLAGSQRSLGLYERAAQTLDTVDRLITEHAPAEHPVRFAAILHRGLLEAETGELEQALELIGLALDGRKRALGPKHPDTLTAGRELGRQFQNLGQHDKAESRYRQTLKGRLAVLGEEHPETLLSMLDLGTLHLIRHELDQAEEWLVQALAGFRGTLGTNHLRTANALANLGVVYRRQGRLEEARQKNAEVLELHAVLLGNNHPDTLRSRNNVGVIHQVQGDYAVAAQHYRTALQGYRQLYGERHPETLNARSNVGTALYLHGDHDEAQHHLELATEGRIELLGEEHPATLVSMGALVGVLVEQGNGEQALALADHIYQVRLQLLGEANPQTLISMSGRGSALRVAGQLTEALAVTRQAFELASQVLPENHWRLATHQAHLARALKAKGREEEAIAELQLAHELASGSLRDDHPFVLKLAADLANWTEGNH